MVDFPVPTRSETICAALKAYLSHYTQRVRDDVDAMGSLLSPRIRATARSLPHVDSITITVTGEMLAALDTLRKAYGRGREGVVFKTRADLIVRVLIDAAASLPS
jgi:hypothetical protein